MTSQKQIEANRRNAQRSKGLRTPAGKARSSKNALSHGVFARQVLLPGEGTGELAGLRDELRRELQPRGPLQEQWCEVSPAYSNSCTGGPVRSRHHASWSF